MRRALFAVLAALAVSSLGRSARADEPRTDADADATSRLLTLARAQAGVGKLVDADASYTTVIDVLASEGADAATLAPLRAERADVRRRAPRLTVHVDGPASARVFLDDREVAADMLASQLVDPGPHVVRASAPGMSPARTTVQAREGGVVDVVLAMAPAPSAPATQDESTRSSTGSTQRTLGWVLVGSGGALLAGGAYFAVKAASDQSSLRTSCSAVCSVEQVDNMKTESVAGNVLLLSGLAAAATGVVVVLTAPSSTAGVRPYVGLGTAGVVGSF